MRQLVLQVLRADPISLIIAVVAFIVALSIAFVLYPAVMSNSPWTYRISWLIIAESLGLVGLAMYQVGGVFATSRA